MNEADMAGQIVVSKCGRDSGLTLVVIGVCEEEFLFVADGRHRKVEKPKKKRLKHLKYTGLYSEKLRSMLLSNRQITNRQVREELNRLVGPGCRQDQTERKALCQRMM